MQIEKADLTFHKDAKNLVITQKSRGEASASLIGKSGKEVM